MPLVRVPRLKLMLAAALAAASILLPLAPVWRQTGAELDLLLAERALLDPVAQALALQRGLLGHAEVSARLLRGRSALEPERRLRQQAVESDLAALQATLAAGLWTRALGEAHSLSLNWRMLAWQVAQRAIGEARSHEAHQLLIEQAVQVMDLVSAAAPPGSSLRLALQAEDRAALEAALLQRGLVVEARVAAVQQARAVAAGAALAAALLLATLAGRVLRRGTPAPGTAREDVRRSHGRRSTDFSGFLDSAVQWGHAVRAAHAPVDRRADGAGPAAAGPGRAHDGDAV